MSNEPTRLDIVYADYKRYITQRVTEKCGGSYVSEEQMRAVWRNRVPYSKSVEDFVVFETKMYLRNLADRHQPWTTEIEFLERLTQRISMYLATYFQKNPEYNQTFGQARARLNDILFNQSAYIQHLRMQAAKNREKRDAKRAAYRKSVARAANATPRPRIQRNDKVTLVVYTMVYDKNKQR